MRVPLLDAIDLVVTHDLEWPIGPFATPEDRLFPFLGPRVSLLDHEESLVFGNVLDESPLIELALVCFFTSTQSVAVAQYFKR
jgi:hypothetical protein